MRFLALKGVLPGRQVDNAEHIARIEAANLPHLGPRKAAQLGQLVRRLFAHSGSQLRFVRAPGETAVDLTARASEAAIEAAGIDRASIDLLIYVGVGRGFLEPAPAKAGWTNRSSIVPMRGSATSSRPRCRWRCPARWTKDACRPGTAC